MAAVGNLNEFVKYQMAQGMAEPGGGGAAGTASELAVGFAIAQQLMTQQGGGLLGGSAPIPPVGGMPAAMGAGAAAASGAAAGAAAGGALADPLMTPEQVAELLGVTPDDVMSTITSGQLKAKQIGSSYRIKRSAVDAFLAD